MITGAPRSTSASTSLASPTVRHVSVPTGNRISAHHRIVDLP
jgi:hypothetical protein